MKRLALFLTILAAAGAAWAQSPKWGYGDTVYAQTAPDTTYYYQWWCEGLGPATNTYLFESDHWMTDEAWWGQYNYTEDSIQVAGIAACIVGLDNFVPGRLIGPTDSLIQQEYLLLFDATPDSLPLKAQVPYHLYDPHRYMHFDFQRPVLGCCDGIEIRSMTLPLYEYYFEKPITVADSFYVGATNNNYAYDGYETGLPIPRTYPEYFHLRRTMFSESFPERCATCPDIPMQRQIAYRANYTWDTLYYNTHAFFLVFPLLEPDTASYVCQGVRGLRVVDMSSTFVQLAWNSHSSHIGFEVNYFPEGTDPDSGTVITCSTPTCRIEGFDRTKSWRANVRALCDYGGATFYSDWSSILFYRYYPPTPPPEEGITADEHDPYVTLMPNPAKENVQVISSYGLKKIEVVDGQGRTVATQDADGHTALMELKGLAAGHYIVLVYTEQGITTKRLVVE